MQPRNRKECSFLVVPYKIAHVKMKLHLNGTIPHVKGTRLETRKSVLTSKQFLAQVLTCLANVCVVLKSGNVIRLFMLPYKTNNVPSDNITYLNVPAGLYVSHY